MPWSKDRAKNNEQKRRHRALHRDEINAYEANRSRRKRLEAGIQPLVKLSEEEKRERINERRRRWRKEHPDKEWRRREERRRRERMKDPERYREKRRNEPSYKRYLEKRKARYVHISRVPRPKLSHEESLKRAELRRRAKGVQPKVRLTDSERIERKRVCQKLYMQHHPERRMAWKSVERMFLGRKVYRNNHTVEYVGCSPGFLRNHIDSLFQPGMTWENYGEWHVDHVVPLSWFPFDEDPSLLFVASHWTNLQPMWSADNIRKSNRFAA